MKLFVTLFMLTVFGLSFSQDGENLYQKGVDMLDVGETTRAYQIFKKVSQMDTEEPKNLAYLSYSITRICYNQDSIDPRDVADAKHYALKSLETDSSFHMARIAYAFALLLENKTLESKKSACKNMLEIKRQLEACIEPSNSESTTHEEVYNLLGIWHREASGRTEMEYELYKTFYDCDITNGKIEEAINNHKSCIEKKKTIRFYYELGLTYQKMGAEELAKSTFETALSLNAKSVEDKRYRELVEGEL